MVDNNYISSRESLVREAANLSNVTYGAFWFTLLVLN